LERGNPRATAAKTARRVKRVLMLLRHREASGAASVLLAARMDIPEPVYGPTRDDGILIRSDAHLS
jgi:hypothetical protein